MDLDLEEKLKRLREMYAAAPANLFKSNYSKNNQMYGEGAKHSKGIYGNLLKTAMNTYGNQINSIYNSQKSNPMYTSRLSSYKSLGKAGSLYGGLSKSGYSAGKGSYSSGGKGSSGGSSSGSSSGK